MMVLDFGATLFDEPEALVPGVRWFSLADWPAHAEKGDGA
jgi:hypothetical protein